MPGRGDGLESVITSTAHCPPLVYRVAPAVRDQEWCDPGVVPWDHFQEVSSEPSIAVCDLYQGKQWRKNAERHAFIVAVNQDKEVVSLHAVMVLNGFLYYVVSGMPV